MKTSLIPFVRSPYSVGTFNILTAQTNSKLIPLRSTTNQQLNNCIRNTTAVCNPRQNLVRDKFSPRQNSVLDKIQNFFLLEKKFVGKKNLRFCLGLNFVTDFQCTFLSCLGQIDAYHHQAVYTCRNKNLK